MASDADKFKTVLNFDRGQKMKYRVYKGLRARGFSKEESAIIMGNLRQESAFDPQAELRGINPDSGIREDSYGLMQWRNSKRAKKGEGRLDKLRALAKEQGKDISDLDVQLDYIKQELTGGGYETHQYKKALKLGKGKTLAEKTMLFAEYVERPANSELKSTSKSYKNRTKAASEFFELDDTTVDALILKTSGELDGSWDAFPSELLEGGEDLKPKKQLDFNSIVSKYANKPLVKEDNFTELNKEDIEQEEKELGDVELGKPKTFKDAFGAARRAGLKEFMWKGERKNTRLAGETKAQFENRISLKQKIDAMADLDPTKPQARENVKAILDEDLSKLVPQITAKTPIIASTGDDYDFVQEEEEAPMTPSAPTEEPMMSFEVEEEDSVVDMTNAPDEIEFKSELPSGLPLDRLGGFKYEKLEPIEDRISNITFEGMGDDLVNKFTDRNAVGFLTQGAIKMGIMDNKVDPSFDIEGSDKEFYNKMTEGLSAEDKVELLDGADNRGDFIKLASLLKARNQRKKDMEKYSSEHPVFSGLNTFGNILTEGVVFMPVSTAIAAAGKATKINSIAQITKSKLTTNIASEAAEQGLQELIWAVNDKEYEFDPLMFAAGLGVGVGLKQTVGSQEADEMFRKLVRNEHGFINIATNEGKKLVDEVASKVENNKAIALAKRITKKKIKVANEIRENLKARLASMDRRLSIVNRLIKGTKDPSELKKLKGKKQKLVRQINKLNKKIPVEMKMLLDGTHPKLTAAINPEFKISTVAKEIGIDPKLVSTVEKARKFLGLDSPDVDPDFVFEGEKRYSQIARNQLKEMAVNRRLNANETLKYMAGTDTVKTLDSLPIIGRLQIGEKLTQLASTDGPMSQYLFNKGNLVSSDNELTASFYNWLAPDGMGRQGASKIRAIESQQKYANIFGGDLMQIYHSHGNKIYEAIEGKMGRVKGLFSPDDYENAVEPILKERLLAGANTADFRAKYGDEIANIADDFYDDFNKLNKKIVERAKELGVEGVNFDATEGWFHRSWDFRKGRSVDIQDLEDGIFRAMKSHAEKLGVTIDDAELLKNARKFAYGIRNADLSTIEGLQSDHIKMLDKLLSKAEKVDGTEAKIIKDEVTRLKLLKAKADAGDLANRVQMDVDVELANGMKLSDLFEDNIIHTQKRYIARMSARIAAAEHGIKNLDDIDDWINDAVELEVKRLAEKGVKNPRAKAEFVEKAMRQDFMSFKTGGMVGIHDLPDDSASDFLRLVRKYNFARLMQYTGLSSLAELHGTFVEAGVSTTLGEMSRYMRQHFHDLYIDNPDKYVGRLYDELRTVTGVGMEDFSFSSKGMSKANRIFESGVLNTAEKGVDVLGRVAQAPFAGIEKVGRRLTVNSLAIKWANHFNETETGGLLSAFFGSNGVTNRVLENSGFGMIDDAGKFIANDSYKQIKKSIKEFATFDDSGRLVKLNLEKWDNKTAHAFGDAIQMQANHIMVSPDATTMALWQSSTVGQILNQFRTFTVNATTKVMGATIANAAISANRGDTSEMIKAGQKIFWGTSLGMLSVALRQGIQKAGGDDEIDLFDDGLIKAAAIGFSRSSIAGNLPTIGDSISGVFGYDPIFEKTSSVGRSKNFFNLSTTPTGQAIGGVYQSIEKAAQGDFKGSGMQLLKVSPVYRQIGAQQIFNFIDDEK